MEWRDIPRVLARRWAVLLAATVVVGGGLTGYRRSRETTVFSAETRLVSPAALAGFLASDPSGQGASARESFISSRKTYALAAEIAILYKGTTGKGLERAGVSDEKLREDLGKKKTSDDAVRFETARLLAAVKAQARDGRAIVVRAVSATEADALLLANAFARAAQMTGRDEAATFLGELAKRADEALKAVEEKVRAARETAGASGEGTRALEARIGSLMAAQDEIDRQLADVRLRREKLRAAIDVLEDAEHRQREALAAEPPEDGVSSAVLDRIRAEIVSIRADIAARRLELAPEDESSRRTNARLSQLQQEHRAELHRARGGAIVQMQEALAALDREAAVLGERGAKKALEAREAGDALRRRAGPRAELASLSRELEERRETRRRIEAALALDPDFHVFREPVESAQASVSGAALRAAPVYGLYGLGAGLLLALLLGASDRALRTDRDVRRHLDLPCLARVPRLRENPYAINALAGDPRYEVYQAAATVLRGYLADREGKTVVVTGATPREGRTSVAVHLAASMARKGLRVVLVDGDLRRPFLHAVFNLDNQRGLTGYLGGAVPEGTDPETLLGPTEIPSLRVLSAGGAVQNPVEMLDSARMADLVRQLRERNDAVVIDSPALETGGDALALARLADATVLVTACGADRDRVARAKEQLVNVRADVAGAVLTFCG